MVVHNISFGKTTYHFEDAELRTRLINLRNAKGDIHWIRADLTTTKSTLIGRIMWSVVKHFSCLRNLFYGVNLEHSKKLLEALSPALNTPKNAELYEIYKDAVASFEQIAPNHLLFSKPSHSRPHDLPINDRHKQLQFEDLVCSSQGMCSGLTDLKIEKDVLELVRKKQPKGIRYNPQKISAFVEGGNCTALSLDFIEKYFAMLKQLPLEGEVEPKLFDKKMTAVGKLYKRGGNDVGRLVEFRSRQAAFNCIEVDKNERGVDFSRAKVESLANFHDFRIGHDSGGFDIVKDARSKLKMQLKQMPEGAYLLRVNKPMDNEKLEEYGHSMVFVRSQHGDYFYDPNLGTEKIEKHTASRIFWHLRRNWNKYEVSEARFYQMTPPNPGTSAAVEDQTGTQSQKER